MHLPVKPVYLTHSQDWGTWNTVTVQTENRRMLHMPYSLEVFISKRLIPEYKLLSLIYFFFLSFTGLWDDLHLYKRRNHEEQVMCVLCHWFSWWVFNGTWATVIKQKASKRCTGYTHEKAQVILGGYIAQVPWQNNAKFSTQEGKTAWEEKVCYHTVYNLPFQHPMKMVHTLKKYTVPYHIWIPSKKRSFQLLFQNMQEFHRRNWRFLHWLLVEKLHYTIGKI